MVKEWLEKYKFKDWNETETTHKKVTQGMKSKRAKEIAEALNNHNRWKTHARSLKKEDLEELNLKITNVEDDDKLKDIVYRIHTVCRLIHMSSNTYKIIATEKNRISFTANNMPPIPNQPSVPEVAELNIVCSNCGKNHRLYLKLSPNNQLDKDAQKKGLKKFPEDNILKCECGFEMNLIDIRNDIETKTGTKTVD